MSTIQGITGVNSSVYSNYKSNTVKKMISEDASLLAAQEEDSEAAVYTSGEGEAVEGVTSKKYKTNSALVAQLKADAENRQQQLRDIVSQTLLGQSQASSLADDDIWSFFAKGDFSNVSEAAKAQAKEDIAEGGYYSVEETSARILDFAKALTGGDPDKIDSMIDAFKKGYDEATKAWGKDLPEISSKTYDAVMKGFEDWRNESSSATE